MGNKLYVFDYDGVILNSLYEKFFVGFNAYININKSSNLLNGDNLTFENYNDAISSNKVILDLFQNLVPFIGPSGENALAFELIENNIAPKDYQDFQNEVNRVSKERQEIYHEEVLKLRRDYGANYKLQLDKLCPVFSEVVDLIKLNQKGNDFEILTTKNLEAVEHFNQTNGLTCCFNAIHVADKIKTKPEFLLEINHKRNINREDIIFIDDFLRHLLPSSKLGFTCVLASWGFNNTIDKELAIKEGINVSDINDLEFIINAK